MKKSIRTSVMIALLILIFPTSLFSQRYRTGDPTVGKSYSMQNFGIDNHMLLREADQQLRTLDLERAALTLDNAVAQSPQSADALIQRAKFRKLLGMTGGAEADLRQANRLNPYAADLYGYNGPHGMLNVLSFEPDEAILELSSEKKMSYYYELLDREFIQSHDNLRELEHLEQVIAQIEAGYLTEALNNLDELLGFHHNLALAHDLKGLVFIKQKKYEEAIAALSTAVVLQPDLAITWYNFSLIEREVGRYDKAREYLDRAIDLQKDFSKAYFERALIHKMRGDQESALLDYNSIINLQDKSYEEALLNRGLTRKMSGDFSGALSDLNQVVMAYPNHAQLYKNRANLYLFFGYPFRAIEDYTKAIQRDAFYAEAYYNRGLAHLTRFDQISGCRDLERSTELGFEPAVEMLQYFCAE